MKKPTQMNRSTRRTRTAIRAALLQVMQEKPISSITVQELIDIANICRTTFYAHYHDIHDLAKSIGDDVIDEVGEALNQLRYESEKLEESDFPTIRSVVNVYERNAETIRLLIGPHGDPTFQRRMEDKIYQITKDMRKDHYKDQFDEKQHKLYSCFVISGGINLLNHLVVNDPRWDLEQTSRMLGMMAAYGERIFIEDGFGS